MVMELKIGGGLLKGNEEGILGNQFPVSFVRAEHVNLVAPRLQQGPNNDWIEARRHF